MMMNPKKYIAGHDTFDLTRQMTHLNSDRLAPQPLLESIPLVTIYTQDPDSSTSDCACSTT
jgi:hypothetical protein